MVARAFLVGLVFTAPLAAADDIYAPGAPGQNTAGAAAAGNNAGIGTAPIGTPTAPATTGISGAATAPGSGSTNPFRNPPSANPLQSTATAYEVAPPAGGAADTQPGTGLKPSAMMRAMLSLPGGTQLRGQPVSLMEVIGGARTRAEQTQRVDAYWDLCSSVADYYLGLREQEELRKLRTYVQQVGPTWQQAESELGVRINTSQLAALASQLRVASLTGRGSGNLPLPADTPHCASYTTHYERIFQGGGPSEAHELAALLPLRYAELKDAATAVTRAEGRLDTAAAAQNGNPDGMQAALELLALRRRAFVQIARDYNRRIARYSELAAPGPISASRLASMLINSGVSTTATKSASPAPPRNRQSSSESSPPRTFVESSAPAAIPISKTSARGDGVQPASSTQPASATSPAPQQERSLLVPK